MTKTNTNIAFVFLLSLSALLLARLHQAEYHLVLMAGTVPLIAYFLALYVNIKTISRAQIDNIYYFGFLITIISLAISACHFNPEQGIKLDLITKQFSVGLVATGLALMFKLILQDLYTDPDEEDMIRKNREELQKFTDEATKMFFQLQLASNSLTELANTSLNTVNKNYESSVEDLKRLQAESLKVISESIEKVIGEQFKNLKSDGDQAAEALKVFGEQIQCISSSLNFKKFNTTIGKLESSLAEFGSNVDNSLSKMGDSTDKVVRHQIEMENLIQASSSATISLLQFRQKVEEDNTIAEKTKVMFDRKISESSKDTIRSFNELTQAINDLSSKFQTTKSFESKVG